MNNFPFFRFPYNNYYKYYNYRNNLNRNISHSNYSIERNSTTCSPFEDNKNLENHIEYDNESINKTTKIFNYRNDDYKKINTDTNAYENSNYPRNNFKNFNLQTNSIKKNTFQKTNYRNYISQNTNCKNNTDCKNDNNRLIKNKSSKFYLGPIVFDSSSFSDSEKPILELLGLKLYLDDILIISLLYFLYEEDVKDETLFISLILLLLS